VLDTDRGIPVRAVLLEATITIALILLGDGFRVLVRITVVALWVFYFLTVLGVVILLVREPGVFRLLCSTCYSCRLNPGSRPYDVDHHAVHSLRCTTHFTLQQHLTLYLGHALPTRYISSRSAEGEACRCLLI